MRTPLRSALMSENAMTSCGSTSLIIDEYSTNTRRMSSERAMTGSTTSSFSRRACRASSIANSRSRSLAIARNSPTPSSIADRAGSKAAGFELARSSNPTDRSSTSNGTTARDWVARSSQLRSASHPASRASAASAMNDAPAVAGHSRSE
jgi:hypothetical protein